MHQTSTNCQCRVHYGLVDRVENKLRTASQFCGGLVGSQNQQVTSNPGQIPYLHGSIIISFTPVVIHVTCIMLLVKRVGRKGTFCELLLENFNSSITNPDPSVLATLMQAFIKCHAVTLALCFPTPPHNSIFTLQ